MNTFYTSPFRNNRSNDSTSMPIKELLHKLPIIFLTEYLSNGLPVYAPNRPSFAPVCVSVLGLGLTDWSQPIGPRLLQPMRLMLSLSLNTPPQAQLEALRDLRADDSGSSWLHASLALLDLFDFARFNPSGRLVCSPAVAVLALLLLPSVSLGPGLIQRVRIKHPNRLGYLQSVFALVRVGCLELVFGLLALDGVISPMLGWLRLYPSTS